MLAACEKVMSYTEGMDRYAFIANEIVYDATLRNLEILGEAASRVPDQVHESHGEILWRALIGTRNRIVNAYLGIDDDIIWTIVREGVPEFAPQLRAMLEDTERQGPAHAT